MYYVWNAKNAKNARIAGKGATHPPSVSHCSRRKRHSCCVSCFFSAVRVHTTHLDCVRAPQEEYEVELEAVEEVFLQEREALLATNKARPPLIVVTFEKP